MSNRLIAKPSASSPSPGDVIFLDGATGVRGLDAGYPAAAISAHNASASAHGFGVYTVAQLNAFTNSNRPIGAVYCSDCLTPDGTGSIVVWNGTLWMCSCGDIRATTALIDYYRDLALNSAVSGNTRKQATAGMAPISTQNSGMSYLSAMPTISSGPTLATILSTGSSANAGIRMSAAGTGIVSTAGASSFYRRVRIGFNFASDGTNRFNYRGGADSGSTYTLGADGFGFVYDNGNVLGGLNPGGTNTWVFFSRLSSVNTLVNTGVAITASGPTEHTLEFLFDGTNLTPYINGTAYTPIAAANVPTNLFLGFFCLNKSAGTANRTATISSAFSAARYTNSEA